jgi:SagB-type dehydrogenase family enzyme
LVTSALLSVLTGQAAPSPPRRLTKITLPGPVVELYEVLPDPECAVCVGGTPPGDEESTMVLGYEWRVRKVALSAERAEAPTPAKQALLASLQRQRDAFPGFPSRQLPDPPGPRRPGAADRRRVDEPAVAGVLARTAGFRGPGNSRWAPSGGNMGSVAVYLVTERDLFGLPGTIFRYLDTGHEVVSVQRDPVALADFLEGTDLDPSRTAVAIALVGEAGRLSQKYEDFAWRLTHLDSGCAALQLHLAAACYGLSATFAARWPARLGEMLELERRSEVVTAIAGLEDNEALPEGDPRCR